jgi:hypothetical protein
MSKPTVETETITFSWPQMQLMMNLMNKYHLKNNPIDMFVWEEIGLRFIRNLSYGNALKGFGWHFEIINKARYIFAKIKYGF